MNIFKHEQIKRTKSDEELDKAIEEFDEYLKKFKKGNPTKPTQIQIQTSSLISAMAHSTRDVKDNMVNGFNDVKGTITTQTIVITLGFIGTGIVTVLVAAFW